MWRGQRMQQYGSVRSNQYFQIELYGSQKSLVLRDNDGYNFFFKILDKYLEYIP